MFPLAIALLLVCSATAQNQTHNLTPDGYWHNRYHAILSMAIYGDYNDLCPNQTFTQESEDRNFPDSPYPPWQVVSTFGPTPSGCQGFTTIVPEMNKALIVFTGSYELEQTLNTSVTSWDAIGLGHVCNGCSVNAFAAQGYMECKNETNNWQDIREAYYDSGLVFSIAGHGLGGMHSLIASVDLNHQNICYYSHNYGTPRTFNQAGANYYNYYFNGEAGERGVAGNDLYTESIPASDDYAHAGTTFYYYGLNKTTSGMNWEICWDGNNDGPIVDDPLCAPKPQGDSTSLEDHYFYFSNVGQCGGQFTQNTTIIDDYLVVAMNEPDPAANISSSSAASASLANASSSTATLMSTSNADSMPTPTSSIDFITTIAT